MNTQALARAGGILALCLAILPAARAQLELKTASFTQLFQGTVPNDADNDPPRLSSQPQFAGVGPIAGGGDVLKGTVVDGVVKLQYPTAVIKDAAGELTGVRFELVRATYGGVFAVGMPRYFFGDVIVPPTTDKDGKPVAAGYWRRQPLAPEESLSGVTNPVPFVAVGSIRIINRGTGYKTAPTVTITAATGSPGSGAAAIASINALGEVVSITVVRSGTDYTSPPTVTLTGDGTAATAVAGGLLPYYHSPHAEKVFATQAGRVTVTWVSAVPQKSTTDSEEKIRTLTEVFSVSTAPAVTPRSIYWTERNFTGPKVQIPATVDTVNPIPNAAFPLFVDQEYRLPGLEPVPTGSIGGNSAANDITQTLWLMRVGSAAELRSYNRQGRLFVEYLGKLKDPESAEREFLGGDVIDVAQAAPEANVTTELGARLQPSTGEPSLIPAPELTVRTDQQQQLYGENRRPDGRTDYYAERENLDPARVVFYWLEKFETPGIRGGASSLGILWPRIKNNYRFVWPADLGRYAHNTVGAAGSTAATGMQFGIGQLPQVIFQDDPTATEARFDDTTQRMVVGLVPVGDGLNRSLLKFTNGSEVWYVRIYTQAEGRAGFQESDELAPITGTVAVGERLALPEAYYAPFSVSDPRSGYSRAGFIAGGTGYHPAAYADPFSVGVAAAERGAIIPVNADPDNRQITVHWFREVTPPNAAFVPFHVPAKIGRYAVVYPANPPRIVLASNEGSGELESWERAGILYVQNQRPAVGFNPNEEHAVMLGGRLYALRDDLNVTAAGSNYTSEPFVLLSYTSPADKRPAMRVFKVVREIRGSADPKDDVLFDYPITAGTPLQGPMPLPLLPVPLEKGTSKNREIALSLDTAPAAAQLTGTVEKAALGERYARFIYEDRKGGKWVYRGPHTTGDTTKSFGMQFYYPMRPEFFVPGMDTQPAAGELLPYLRPLDNGVPQGEPVKGTPLTIRYRPTWPANAPELRLGETLTLPKFGLPAVLPQASAKVLYQQSVAQLGTDKAAVVLHDPIRERLYALGDPDKVADAAKLQKIPASALTTVYQGKTYFQRLPPHLQSRFHWDPNRGRTGSLVLTGQFKDEAAGEDYLLLNVLSVADALALRGLVTASDPNKAKWDAAIAGLSSRVETFVERVEKPGDFKVESFVDVAASQAIAIGDQRSNAAGTQREVIVDTAVVDYALTATGLGNGWVTMLFGNGRAFTPEGEPVAMKVFKVVPQLHPGELKVIPSRNPLDEQVTVRHSGDFAARADQYEFEWRYAPPNDGVAPEIYSFSMGARFAAGKVWNLVASPAGDLPSAAEYGTARSATLPRTGEIYTLLGGVTVTQGGSGYISVPEVRFTNGGGTGAAAIATIADGAVTSIRLTQAGTGYTSLPTVTLVGGRSTAPNSTVATAVATAAPATSKPGVVLRYPEAVSFADLPLHPGRLVLSAEIGDLDGFILYVNGAVALAYNVPGGTANTPASTGLIAAPDVLGRQFALDPNAFAPDGNTIEVALYTTALPGSFAPMNFQLHASSDVDLVESGSTWIPAGKLSNVEVVGAGSSGVLGSPLLVMTDNYVTVRYRPAPGSGSIAPKVSAAANADYKWSRWSEPKPVEGWIKRVLAGINPFNQRVKDLYNNAVNTDVSILTQAGKRWDGDVALTLDSINDFGLIEIYETVLNRGKNISIDSGYDYGPANDALLLAAGYLADLYVALGNEAYADAANSTISADDTVAPTEVSTARFSFERQVKNVLEEEMALLRGRDNFIGAPGVTAPPAYNRLYWNYTRGIDAGEVIYATNYNIREKAGSPTADGNLDAADAQRMFPQAHGDAYGHYLTALKGYYKLLRNQKFTWTPRSEAVTVLGQVVQVDYVDEQKFAGAAANVARTAQQVLALQHRAVYDDDAAAGWTHFQDDTSSPAGEARHWSFDDWASRGAQGSFYHWVVGNALLPEKDIDPKHSGVQVIDRSTVTALLELPVSGESIQTTMDQANARLNPLALSPGAIAFDLSPAELKAGVSHYEQVQQRALRAVLNAKGAFDQAAKMTRLLRSQEIQVSQQNDSIVDQESAFNRKLIEIYGTPYSNEIGAGKTYAQGYAGPDLELWFVVDRTSTLIDSTQTANITTPVPVGIINFGALKLSDLKDYLNSPLTRKERTFTVQANSKIQYSDVFFRGATGSRVFTGSLQQALVDFDVKMNAVKQAANRVLDKRMAVLQRGRLVDEMLSARANALARQGAGDDKLKELKIAQTSLKLGGEALAIAAENIKQLRDDVPSGIPAMSGLAIDTFAGVRGALRLGLNGYGMFVKGLGLAVTKSTMITEYLHAQEVTAIARDLEAYGFSYQEAQTAYEWEILIRDLMGEYFEVAEASTILQQAGERVKNLMAEGERIQAERELFRQRAAALVQGFRTRDLTFRTFRNESLEQYRSLFDLASRYTYLAAKSYDYETGLLGSATGKEVFRKIVASRALGDLTGGQPQASVSTLGDDGLAGTMARLQADWSVAKGRLGINNPDQNGTLFSLRQELFRIDDKPVKFEDDDQWRQTLEQHFVPDLMADADVRALCMNIRKADGSAVPGILIPFATEIHHGKNFFSRVLAQGDHAFSASNFATKIYSVGLVLPGYKGLDPYRPGTVAASTVTTDSDTLSATPYVYLIPTGSDYLRAPPLGDTDVIRGWRVADQALPLPFNLGATAFSATQYFNADGTLTEQPWIIRKHQAFRPVGDANFFYGSVPAEFTSSRLVGRSVWNGQWKLVIPAYMLLGDQKEGLDRFARTVKDIQLFLRTYSHAGN